MIVQYKPKRNLLQTIIQMEIIQGLALTLRKLFSPPITRQYPKEKPPIYPGFRGQQALVRDPQSGTSKCVACLRCAQICPSRCISIQYHEDEATSRRIMDSFNIEALRCVYCGYCVEVCPVNAITLTEIFEYASYDRQSCYFDKERLLSNWDNFMQSSTHDQASYVNPFWRPRGLPESELPAAKRVPVPDDWCIENQFVGIRCRDTEDRRQRTEDRGVLTRATSPQPK